jgi:ATP-dependent DNA ligase
VNLCLARRPKRNLSSPCCSFGAERLPEEPDRLYEMKLDGYRAIAAKTEGPLHLWSRNEKDFG